MKVVIALLLFVVVAVAQQASGFRQVTFANLGVPGDNNVRYVVDGAVDPATGNCLGGGFGVYAFRVQTGASTFVWRCTTFPPGGGGPGSVTSVGLSAPSEFTVSGSPVTSSGTLALSYATGQSANRFLATPNGVSGALGLRAIAPADFIVGALTPSRCLRLNSSTQVEVASGDCATGGTVTSVALTMPAPFTVSGSPVTSNGTFAVSFTGGQTANRFLATPNGSTGAVSLRAIAPADVITGGVSSSRCLRTDASGNIVVATGDCGIAGGTVSSVGLSLPNIFSISGSPVTTTGTLTATFATQSANTIFSGPATGSAATPAFRALVAADIPAITESKLSFSDITTANATSLAHGLLPKLSGSSADCFRGNGTYVACTSGTTAPGGSTTQFQFNNAGVFGGASNVTYTSTTGQVTMNQAGNGNQTLYGKRVTDSGPTGNFILFQNQAASTDLFKVDVNGNLTSTGTMTLNSSGGTDGIMTITSAASGGGIQLTSGTKPTCDSTKRFLFWTVAGGSGVKDTVEVCAKDAANSYAWRTIY